MKSEAIIPPETIDARVGFMLDIRHVQFKKGLFLLQNLKTSELKEKTNLFI